MRMIFNGALAAAVLMAGSVGLIATDASAQSPRQQQRIVERFCDQNPGARDCRDFRRSASRWDERRYQRFYRDNRRDRDFDDDAATAAIFGLAAGAIAGGLAGQSRGSESRIVVDEAPRGQYRVSAESVARCAQRYRSYDSRTHSYVANSSGERRVCQL